MKKKYILIAGVNGAGKSTLYQTLDSLKVMERVNTDEIVKAFGDWKNSSDVMKAGKIAVNKIKDYFELNSRNLYIFINLLYLFEDSRFLVLNLVQKKNQTSIMI